MPFRVTEVKPTCYPGPMFTAELKAAEEIARAAGTLLLRFYRGTYTVDLKSGGEPVTEADRAANEYIVGRLSELFPKDIILAEESPRPSDTILVPRLWVIDPMDGTKEFINHTDEFAVMIGLIVGGRPVLGVVNQPATRTLYRGVVGSVAEIERDGVTTPIQVSSVADPTQMRLIVSRSHTPEVVLRMAQRLGVRETLRSGSVGLKIGSLGIGACELYLHPSDGTKLWDAGAPEAILKAAGGTLTDFDGTPIDYDPADVHNRRGLLASNGCHHNGIVEKLRGMF